MPSTNTAMQEKVTDLLQTGTLMNPNSPDSWCVQAERMLLVT